MSIRLALEFIQHTRQDATTQKRLRALGPGADLEKVAALGAELGYAFSAHDLQAAFKYDWAMRRAFYSGGKPALLKGNGQGAKPTQG